MLENAALVAKEKLKEAHENKKKKPRYDATDDGASLLPQYDEKQKVPAHLLTVAFPVAAG